MLIAPAGPGTVRRLGNALKKWGYEVSKEGPLRFTDIYLETGDGKCQKAGLRVRVRRSPGLPNRLQVLKIGEIPLRESELEQGAEIGPGRNSPVVNLQAGTPAADTAIETAGNRRLLAFLRTVSTRWEYRITTPSGSEVSVSAESFRANSKLGDREPFSAGLISISATESPSSCEHLRVFLRDRMDLQFEEMDHFALAGERLGLHLPGNRAEVALAIGSADPIGLAGRKIIGQQLLRIRGNVSGTIGGWDTEFLHDLRVAVRRTRSALRIFSMALGESRARVLREDLRQIGTSLGALRDLDVFAENLRSFSGFAPSETAAEEVIRLYISKLRAEGGTQLLRILTHKGFYSVLARLESLSGSPCPKTVRAAYTPLAMEAPRIIEASHSRVLKTGRRLGANPSPEELHRMRILFKRLRYTCEFLSQAFPGPLGDLIKTCVKLQDCLGEHQDAIVAIGRYSELAAKLHEGGKIDLSGVLEMGGLIQVERSKASQRRRDFSGLWKDFLERYGRLRADRFLT